VVVKSMVIRGSEAEEKMKRKGVRVWWKGSDAIAKARR
jgi:hypothetical protein